MAMVEGGGREKGRFGRSDGVDLGENSPFLPLFSGIDS